MLNHISIKSVPVITIYFEIGDVLTSSLNKKNDMTSYKKIL